MAKKAKKTKRSRVARKAQRKRARPQKKTVGYHREIASLHQMMAELEAEYDQSEKKSKLYRIENEQLRELCGDVEMQRTLRKFNSLEPQSRSLIVSLIKKLHRKRKMHS
jgi:hypothetical protein